MKSIRPPGRKDKEPSPPADDGDFDEGEFADTVFGDSDDTTTGGWWWSDGDLAGDRALRPAGPSTPSPAEGPRPKLAETAKPGPSAAADAQPLAPSRGPGITTARPARAIEAQRTAAGAEARERISPTTGTTRPATICARWTGRSTGGWSACS